MAERVVGRGRSRVLILVEEAGGRVGREVKLAVMLFVLRWQWGPCLEAAWENAH